MNKFKFIGQEETICNDPTHTHKSQIIKTMRIEVNEHKVVITQTDDVYGASIDNQLFQIFYNSDDIKKYITENTNDKLPG
jgi:hypothetical protein